ncbi:hypothetical protein Q5P01_001597 [Channa striata]|uniref:PGC-1 and ERR-induced regulator in muscle protein 1 n=1 Tax=Channa striata TaxID=64152 RepID=A0AA88NPT7_CHASR|nr:hypothetical protein Q5P01_001597 [Channa striata]
MDDLDHSMHIAEYDWTSFYEESEECSLLQPSLACLDNLSLSDSENSEILSPDFSTRQQETKQSPDVKSDGAEDGEPGFRIEEESCVELLVEVNTSATGGEQVKVTAGAKGGSVTQVDCELSLICPAENTFNTGEVHVKTVEDTERTNELSHVKCSEVSKELKKEDRDLQRQTDDTKDEPDSVLLHQTKLNLNESNNTQEAGSETVSSVVTRAEKERWFVTVNDRPTRQRVPVSSVKKKTRQKKLCWNKCSSRQEQPVENGFTRNRGKNESERGTDTRGFAQSNPNVQNSGRPSSSPKKHECTLDSSQMPCKDEKISKNSHSLKKHTIEQTMDRNTYKLTSSASSSDETFTRKDILQESKAFFSVHSYDSENCLSAAKPVVDSPHPLTGHLIKDQQLSLKTRNLPNTGDTRAREIHSCDSTLSCDMSATNCQGCESTSVESILAFPSVGQRANKMPHDNSTCDNDTHSTGLCRPSYTLTPPKQENHLLASGGSSGRKFGPLPVPDLTVTPCSVANSPETYARAAGHRRPVYAISAFWDEMEKLTINDILQLRMSSSISTQDDSPPSDSFLVGTMHNNVFVGGLMDTSDMADSDYFTQPDECKPDCSSCEFSTSDLEEEYCQFIGDSRNSSPNPQGETQQEESMSTCSEEKETPVPLQDFAGRCIGDQESHTLSKVSWPRQITNISLKSLVDNDEGNLFVSGHQSLDENMVLKVKDTMETRIPAPVLSSTEILNDDYQISIPEVFEYFFKDDKGNDSGFVTIYDPENISVDSVFDCTLCSIRDLISFSSLHDSQQSEKKPIPIFSCSHPTVRELTFPKLDYVSLNADCEEEAISPIRIISCTFTQASDYGAGWKSLLLPMGKICFHDKGSIWYQRSGVWVFPFKPEKTQIKSKSQRNAVIAEGNLFSTPSQLFREQTLQQRIVETICTRRDGIFSTLKQSDMCLVCIAFASWVLRSSDPEAADTWKAALLANLSALSAIQFLRGYVKKNPPLYNP